MADILFCLSQLAYNGFASLDHENLEHLGSILAPISCPGMFITYTISVYITVLLSFERYWAICQQKMVTYREVFKYVCCIIIISHVVNIPYCLMYKWRTNEDDIITVDFNMDLNCNEIFYTYAIKVVAVIKKFIIPVILLIYTNVLTVRKVRL